MENKEKHLTFFNIIQYLLYKSKLHFSNVFINYHKYSLKLQITLTDASLRGPPHLPVSPLTDAIF